MFRARLVLSLVSSLALASTAAAAVSMAPDRAPAAFGSAPTLRVFGAVSPSQLRFGDAGRWGAGVSLDSNLGRGWGVATGFARHWDGATRLTPITVMATYGPADGRRVRPWVGAGGGLYLITTRPETSLRPVPSILSSTYGGVEGIGSVSEEQAGFTYAVGADVAIAPWLALTGDVRGHAWHVRNASMDGFMAFELGWRLRL
ncbi:MAG TPA: hypothetical protein VF363_07875 [Candidatus Eisenbacteria bacterium]